MMEMLTKQLLAVVRVKGTIRQVSHSSVELHRPAVVVSLVPIIPLLASHLRCTVLSPKTTPTPRT